MHTAWAHGGLGVKLRRLAELQSCETAEFREAVEANHPCVLRGIASRWAFVERGRFDPAMTAELCRRMGRRACQVSFDPSSTLFGFDVPDDWPSSRLWGVGEGASSSTEEFSQPRPTDQMGHVEKKGDALPAAPRLLNPGRIAMPFASFVDACDRKARGLEGTSSSSTSSIRVVNMPYDEDDADGQEFGHARTGLKELPVDVPSSVLDRLALYCVEDAQEWPSDLLEQLGAKDPAIDVMPEWSTRLCERRIWMSAGGPEGVAHVTAGFHWDQYQNIHVVLSGRKEVFLVHPLEGEQLHATRYCPQAQWRMEHAEGDVGARVVMSKMASEESSSDYALVAVDRDFASNVRCSPSLAQLGQEEGRSPSWAVLRPGDAVYIPPGWWHSIRTWRPRRSECGVPFALSVNYWYGLGQQVDAARRSELFTLQVLSCQRALAGDPRAHLDRFLQRLEHQGGTAAHADEHLPTSLEEDAECPNDITYSAVD